MQFKAGDKVRFTGEYQTKFDGLIGTIVEIREAGREFPYAINITGKVSVCIYPVLTSEIEKISTKYQQLLFEFMG